MSQNMSRAIVVKLGGSVFDARDTTLADLVNLQKEGYKLIVVHGGAKMVTGWCADLGIKSQFHEGERVTDRKSLDVVTAVLAGLVNKETVAAIIRRGGRAVGISGVDGGLVQGHVRNAALGYIGEITRIDPRLLESLLEAGYIPVVSPVSYCDTSFDNEPLLLNINGDTVAGEIAAAMGAATLVYLTDVAGIQGAGGKTLESLSPREAQILLDSGIAAGGMIPKIKSCLVAAGAGTACHIVDGRRSYALREAVAGAVIGTTISKEISTL
jgi:acetylglutamate kinase